MEKIDLKSIMEKGEGGELELMITNSLIPLVSRLEKEKKRLNSVVLKERSLVQIQEVEVNELKEKLKNAEKLYKEVTLVNTQLAGKIPSLEQQIKDLQDENLELKKKIDELEKILKDRQRKLVLGQISFGLENVIKQKVLVDRHEELVNRLKIRDFFDSKIGFKLKDEEAKKWKEVKDILGLNDLMDLNFFLRSMKQLKVIRLKISHQETEISKDNAYRLIEEHFKDSLKSYYEKDAKRIVDAFCKLTGEDVLFKKLK